MWNITPENLKLNKEELKGRRAAVEARYADELKAISSDLDEIETFERVAYAIALKHLPDATEVDAPHEPPDPLAALEPDTTESSTVASEPEGQLGATRASSRWRIRADMAEAER